ncbi:hypothetical protein CAL26_21060 [Bordetella genomosp. 9]|uniref:Uncharacterized protein n=1 Tax=Bordetella genomosp. 9 TaxID=1416803 RepID=A0A261R4W4_9BORD|nr:hypothetical protein [Bordetella genomosp. 9]OZI20046.1 hypothetical protein CAL26_21060 [Bordetella genomosp. 9]
MNFLDLPYPGQVNRSIALRQDAARAISQMEALCRVSEAGPERAAQLGAFFQACADACTALVPAEGS